MATERGTGWNSEAAQGILYKELPGTAGTHPILMTGSLTLAGVTSSPTPEGGGPEHWGQEFTEPEPVGAHTEGPRRLCLGLRCLTCYTFRIWDPKDTGEHRVPSCCDTLGIGVL